MTSSLQRRARKQWKLKLKMPLTTRTRTDRKGKEELSSRWLLQRMDRARKKTLWTNCKCWAMGVSKILRQPRRTLRSLGSGSKVGKVVRTASRSIRLLSSCHPSLAQARITYSHTQIAMLLNWPPASWVKSWPLERAVPLLRYLPGPRNYFRFLQPNRWEKRLLYRIAETFSRTL